MTKEQNHYILMADIINSTKQQGVAFMKEFKCLATISNTTYKNSIVSPLTITLGDEFQGIVSTLKSAFLIIFKIEELIIEKKIKFRLRYSVSFGPILTPINSSISHGMYGSGLTMARKNLEDLKKTRKRISIDLSNKSELARIIELTFNVYFDLINYWSEKDFLLIDLFLKHDDYKIVAELHNKRRDQIWKRRKSLKIESYNNLKQIITHLAK